MTCTVGDERGRSKCRVVVTTSTPFRAWRSRNLNIVAPWHARSSTHDPLQLMQNRARGPPRENWETAAGLLDVMSTRVIEVSASPLPTQLAWRFPPSLDLHSSVSLDSFSSPLPFQVADDFHCRTRPQRSTWRTAGTNSSATSTGRRGRSHPLRMQTGKIRSIRVVESLSCLTSSWSPSIPQPAIRDLEEEEQGEPGRGASAEGMHWQLVAHGSALEPRQIRAYQV